MSIKEEKELIKLELDQVEDIHIVEAIKNILALGKAKRYEQELKPMSIATFYERNKLSRQAIDENNLVSQNEAKSYFARKYAR